MSIALSRMLNYTNLQNGRRIAGNLDSSDNDSESGSCKFRDDICGKPVSAQHLVIDFTPNEELDTEVVTNKILAFWDFVDRHPGLEELVFLPDKEEEEELTEVSSNSGLDYEETHLALPCERTAVSMLDLAGKSGLLHSALKTALPKPECSFREDSYEIALDYFKGLSIEDKNLTACHRKLEYCICVQRQADRQTPQTTGRIRQMNQIMVEWDEQHPKSMDPPGHSPTLTHCQLPRKFVI